MFALYACTLPNCRNESTTIATVPSRHTLATVSCSTCLLPRQQSNTHAAGCWVSKTQVTAVGAQYAERGGVYTQ